ncbi:MAG TPA: DUF4397 domain-containing protein [Gemmatimonadales bacterium]|nr:DUF4397 domain-containing protein [Gemmatimonadales bacterium]
MTNLKGLFTGMLAGGAVLLSAACNNARDTGAVSSKTAGGTSNAPASDVAEKRDVALVRVVNAVPAGPVTIFAGDSTAFSDVGYKKATPFREIPDDRFNFKLGSADTPLAENRENLSGGGHYTIIAMPDEGGADKRNLRVLDDDLKPVSPEKARVRVVNAVPGDLEVSVYVRGRQDPLFDGINFKSEAGWNEIDPIAGTLELRPEGKKNVLASLPEVKFEGGKSYTFVVAGTASKPEIIKIEDDVVKDVSAR